MKINLVILFLLFLLPATLLAQQAEPDTTALGQYDFWVGTWEVSWEESDGSMGRGVNRVEKVLDGRVIRENFEITEGGNAGFKGTSISVYQPPFDRWKQAWADNSGGYFDFTGKVEGDRKMFQTDIQELEDGRRVTQRMVFYDITEDSLKWDWEMSEDGGETWGLSWRIFYKRKAERDSLLIGTAGLNVSNYIIPTDDGHYLTAGYITDPETSQIRGSLVKFDRNLDTLWMNTYGEVDNSRLWSAVQTEDGGYLSTGFTDSNGNQDVWLVKTDGDGVLEWERTFGGGQDDLAWDIKSLEDGQFIIAAQTASKGAGNFDAWLLKVNGQGELIWDRTYGSEGRERVFSITEGTQGEICSTGIHTPGPAEGPIDVYSLCVNAESGDLIWEDILDLGEDDTGHGVLFDKRGGVWVGGYTTSGDAQEQDGFLARYEDGEVADFFTYGGAGMDRIMNVAHGLEDDLWLVGYSNSYGDDFDIWAVRTDYSGNVIGEPVTIPGAGFDRGVHILIDPEGVFIGGTFNGSLENVSSLAIFQVGSSQQ